MGRGRLPRYDDSAFRLQNSSIGWLRIQNSDPRSAAPRPNALVTGASAGIGRELARILALDHDLILTARRADELKALALELQRDHGAVCRVIPSDLAEPYGPSNLFAAVTATGLPIDVLVNNAGFGGLGPFATADLGTVLRMVQVNVAALTELMAHILPTMLARGRGRILNVGSVAGFQPGPMMAAYYATKAYVNSLSQAVANEVRGTGVSVTCLCPGPTESEFGTVAGFRPAKSFSVGHRMSARAVAEAGVRGMRRGAVLVTPGWRNRLLLFVERFAPRQVVTGVVRWMLDKRR